MFNVYKIEPKSYNGYRGLSLVAANTIEDANKYIEDLKKNDVGNNMDSGGYCSVNKNDFLDGVYSEKAGIIHYGIEYYG